MTPEDRLQELIMRWRENAATMSKARSNTYAKCADEFEALVRTGAVETPLEVHADRFEECGHWKCDDVLKRHPELARGAVETPLESAISLRAGLQTLIDEWNKEADADTVDPSDPHKLAIDPDGYAQRSETYEWCAKEATDLLASTSSSTRGAVETPAQEPLTFTQFSAANRERCESPQGFNYPLGGWDTSDWFLAVMGELGEGANVAKKLNRVRDGIPGNKETPEELRAKLRKECGDVFVYLDLLAQAHDFSIADAAVEVFDLKSAEIGYPIQLRSAPSIPPPAMPQRIVSQTCQQCAGYLVYDERDGGAMCAHCLKRDNDAVPPPATEPQTTYRSTRDEILAAMDTFGGGFVKQLARLFRQGDPQNQRLLEQAFRHYFQEYDEIAIRVSAPHGADTPAERSGMSQKNVAEVVTHKVSGELFEVLYLPRVKAFVRGDRFVRMGPAGQPRSKRRWVPIADAMNHYESATAPVSQGQELS